MEVSDSPCLNELACKEWSEHLSEGSEWQWDRVQGFGPLKPVSISDNPPPPLDPQLAGQRPLSTKSESSRPLCSPHHKAHGGEEERLLKFLSILSPTNKPAVELVTPLPSSTR